MSKKAIGILVGSLRRDSFSKKVARYIADSLSGQFEVRFMDISSLAMYNEDLDNETDTPQNWRDFRREINAAHAVLFVTPEYNRSIPPVLKNALDIASRPMGANAWSGKPGAVVSVSPGMIGGFGGANHLRQSASCLNIHMMQQPEAYIGGVSALVDENGVSNKGTQEFLQKFADAFTDWINRLAP
jgi:chromate reductase